MGQPNRSKNRNRGSASGYFLSPSRGASSVPMHAKVTLSEQAGRSKVFLSALPYAIGSFGLAFLASCITASIMTPVQNSDATTQLNLRSNSVAYFVNIASSSETGVISKDINATYLGTRGVITDNLNITSNTPQGYKVYISMASNTHGQYLYNTTDDSFHLSPTAENTLNTANTWGVAVADTYNANFSTNSAYIANPIAASTKFMAVPAHGSEALLINRAGDTPTQDGNGTTDMIPVYYGYYANSGLPSGTYSNTVLYTAYAEATDQTGGIAEASGTLSSYKADNQTISFLTSLYTNRTLSTSQATVTIGGKSCPVTAISQEGAGNDSIRVTCTAPAQDRPGTYDAIISIPDYGHTSSTTVSYDTPGITATVAGVETTITEMQEMTSDICEAWDDVEDSNNYDTTNHRPYAYTGGASSPNFRAGSNLNITIASDDEAATNWNSVISTFNASSGPAITNINADVPEAYLQDSRDNNYYRIRKLADGNCWMTEDLRLIWTAGDNIETASGSTWNPHNTTETPASNTAWGSDPETSSEMGWNERGSQYDHSYFNATTKAEVSTDTQKIGAYYNWKAATAGTGDYSQTSPSYLTDSICPSGWKLPVNTGNKSFENLVMYVYSDGTFIMGAVSEAVNYQKLQGAKMIAIIQSLSWEPLSFLRNGLYSQYGNIANTNELHYWTSNAASKELANSLLAYVNGDSSNIYPRYTQNSSFKSRGFNVRCVSQ